MPPLPPLPPGVKLGFAKQGTPVAKLSAVPIPPTREHYYYHDPNGIADYYVILQLAGESLTWEWSETVKAPWHFLASWSAPSSDQYTVVSVPSSFPQLTVRVTGQTNAPAAARLAGPVEWKEFKTPKGKVIRAMLVP